MEPGDGVVGEERLLPARQFEVVAEVGSRLASSSDAMHTLELLQLQSDQGPCLEAYRTGEQVVNLDLAAVGSRWPRFAPRAAAEGFRSAHSFPMRLRRRTLGALNLLRSEPGALDEADIAADQALADIATIAIIQHQVVIDAPLCVNLQ